MNTAAQRRGFQEFPKWVYGTDRARRAQIVQDKDEEERVRAQFAVQEAQEANDADGDAARAAAAPVPAEMAQEAAEVRQGLAQTRGDVSDMKDRLALLLDKATAPAAPTGPAIPRAAELARPPSPAAVRMRRTRMRRREGKRAICCDISAAQIEALAVAGFLDPAKRDDQAEVAKGVGRLMDHISRSVQGAELGALAEAAR